MAARYYIEMGGRVVCELVRHKGVEPYMVLKGKFRNNALKCS